MPVSRTCGPPRFRFTSPRLSTGIADMTSPSVSGGTPARSSVFAASRVEARNSRSGFPPAFLMVMETTTGFVVSSVSIHHGCTISSCFTLCECACAVLAASSVAAASARALIIRRLPSERIRDAGEEPVARLRLQPVHVIDERNAEGREPGGVAVADAQPRRQQQHMPAGVRIAYARGSLEIVPLAVQLEDGIHPPLRRRGSRNFVERMLMTVRHRP